MPQPLYDPRSADPAYHLRYSWTGWPSQRRFETTPVEILDQIRPLWEQDHLRLLEYRWTSEMVQLLFSTTPAVSPVLVAGRAKGRLDYALRKAGYSMPFSRKLAVRSVGDNTRAEVEAYIERQVGKERFVDHVFAEELRQFTVVNDAVDLSNATEVAHGRYWYNLHLVLVVQERFRVSDLPLLATIRDSCLRIAANKGHAISRLSVMPDHLHVALRGRPQESPEEMVFGYQNNLAYILSQGRFWCDNFYVGTFGEYTMDAVRRRAREEA